MVAGGIEPSHPVAVNEVDPTLLASPDQLSTVGDEDDAGRAQVEIDSAQLCLVEWREVVDDLQVGTHDGTVRVARKARVDPHEAGAEAATGRVERSVARNGVDVTVSGVSGQTTRGLPDAHLVPVRAQVERTDLPEAGC